jgi:hypothetical protein
LVAPTKKRFIAAPHENRNCRLLGISMGSALAMTISWSVHKSILWAILHGVCSWLYVIYYAVIS